MKSSEKDFEFIVESCKKLGYEINIISKPTTTERKMIERSLKLKQELVSKFSPINKLKYTYITVVNKVGVAENVGFDSTEFTKKIDDEPLYKTIRSII
jgi:hypothetical protein